MNEGHRNLWRNCQIVSRKYDTDKFEKESNIYSRISIKFLYFQEEHFQSTYLVDLALYTDIFMAL